MVKKLAIAFVLLFFIFGYDYSFAQDNSIEVNYESVNPGDGGKYILKRLREKMNLFFSFSSNNKLHLLQKQTNIRLAELKRVVEKKEMAYFEKSTQRYFSTAGQLTNFLLSKKLKDNYQETRNFLSSHIPVLTRLRDTYNYTTAEWRFMEDDINYVKIYIERLSSDP